MRKTQARIVVILFGILFLSCSAAFGQVATGTPPFGSFGGGPDVINLANLNWHITVPVINKPGRGLNFNYDLTYDSSVWYPVTSGSTTSWQPVNYWGWNVQTAVTTGYVTYKTTTGYCFTGREVTGTRTIYSSWVYIDQFGVTHSFSGTSQVLTGTCGNTFTGMHALATDGSGYTLTSADGDAAIAMTSRSGKVINPPFLSGSGAGTATDSNGNQISVSATGVFTDTLNQTALTVSQNAPSPSTPTTFTYVAPSGADAVYTMNYTSYTVATNFGVSGIVEYGKTAQPLVSSIVLPDHTEYTFTYEATPTTPSPGACTPLTGTYSSNCVTARIKSVQLPTGGTISYGYTDGNNGILADGTAATLTRTTPDGVWKYSRALGTAPASTTTITDPESNSTVINFQGIYETERIVNQGSGTPLKTIFTCYNGGTPNCNSTAIALPIASRAQ